jgi:hypothetical protein
MADPPTQTRDPKRAAHLGIYTLALLKSDCLAWPCNANGRFESDQRLIPTIHATCTLTRLTVHAFRFPPRPKP